MKEHLRNKFLAGIFAAIPIAVTVFVLWYVEQQTRRFSPVDVPFVGVAVAIVGLYGLGVVVTSLLGRSLLKLTDRLLSSIPGLRELYTAWKQVTLTPNGSRGIYDKVVLIPDGQGGRQTIGFTSGQGIPGDAQTACVFVPAAPNPTSGRLYLIPLASCRFVDISAEEAFKMILSGGNYVPRGLGRPGGGAGELAGARAGANA